MIRRPWLVLLLALAALLTVTLIGSSRGDRQEDVDEGVTPADIARAERDGRAACAGFTRVLERIEENEAAEGVLATLDRAIGHAADAADRDPAWRPLVSGLQAVRTSLQRDDPRAAELGLRVIGAACEEQAGA